MNTPTQSYTNQEKLFLKGIKKTIYVSTKGKQIKRLKDLDYPYIVATSEGLENYLFFQNEQAMKEFMDEHQLKEPFMKINDRLIGEVLNFPPDAYKTYPAPRKERCIVDYHGITFTCRKKDLLSCLEYMKNNYEIPKELQIGVTLIYKKANDDWEEIKIKI